MEKTTPKGWFAGIDTLGVEDLSGRHKDSLLGTLEEAEAELRSRRAAGDPVAVPVWLVFRTPKGDVEVVGDAFDALFENEWSKPLVRTRAFMGSLSYAKKYEKLFGEDQAWVGPLRMGDAFLFKAASEAVEAWAQSACPGFRVWRPSGGHANMDLKGDKKFSRRQTIDALWVAVDEELHPQHGKTEAKAMAKRQERAYAEREAQISGVLKALGPAAVWRTNGEKEGPSVGGEELWESFVARREAAMLDAAASLAKGPRKKIMVL